MYIVYKGNSANNLFYFGQMGESAPRKTVVSGIDELYFLYAPSTK